MSDFIERQESKGISEINKFIDGLEEIFADIRERHVDDSVCGLCEYDGAYMGQSGDWCNECPGFDKDDCFKLSDETRKKWIEKIVNTYPDHTADVSKKVSISCGRENDVISRKAAIEALARMMPRSCTPDGSHPADEEIFRAQEIFVDCIEALEILPPAQPEILACGEGELNVPDTNVGDMISRQAAIDAICAICGNDCDKSEFIYDAPQTEQVILCPEHYALSTLPSAQPEPTQEIQDILDYLDTVLHPIVSPEHWDVYSKLHDMVSSLPSAQPEGIPLEWIDKHLEWLDNCDNDFAQLAKVSIKAMVELWKKDRI